jgi:hypothetical protein
MELGSHSKCFVVFDALDELSEKGLSVVDTLFAMAADEGSSSPLLIAVTSREPCPINRQDFSDVNISAQEDDMTKAAKELLRPLSNRIPGVAAFAPDLISTVISKADGM